VSGSTGDSKVDCKEIGCKNVDWINLAHDEVQWPAVTNVVISLWGP